MYYIERFMHRRTAIRAQLLLPSLLLLLNASCSVDTILRDDVVITCTGRADCPEPLVCTSAGVCADERVNLPPTAAVVVVQTRPLAAADLEVQLTDPNGPSFGDDTVSLAVRFAIGGGAMRDATLSTTVSGLEARTDGSDHLITWDILADATAGGSDLHIIPALVVNDPSPAFAVEPQLIDAVAFSRDVMLELTPTDDGTPAGVGAPVETRTFDVGNTPPTIALTTTGRSFSGEAHLDFVLGDDAGDVANIELQMQLPGETLWRRLDISLGDLNALAPRDEVYSVLWNTAAEPNSDPLAPQGVGSVNLSGVKLRLRAYDHPVGDAHYYSAWQIYDGLAIINQTPPTIEAVQLLNQPLGRVTGGLAISYRLIDDQADDADVAIEYSVDGGGTWLACAELPVPHSQGRTRLTSRPTTYDDDSGMPHIFFWDVLSDLRGTNPWLLIRLRPADAAGPGSAVTLSLGNTVGRQVQLDPNSVDWQLRSITDTATSWHGPMVVGNFSTGDAILDVAGINGTAPFEIVQLLDLDGSIGSSWVPTPAVPPEPEPVGAGLAAADFNGDGITDLATVVLGADENVVDVYLSNGTSTPFDTATGYAVPARSVSTGSEGLFAGDFDGDGNQDLVIGAETEVFVLLGDGTGQLAVDSVGQGFPVAEDSLIVAVGDLDGDGRDDVITNSLLFVPNLRIFPGQGRSAPGDPALGAPQDRVVPAAIGRLVLLDMNHDGLRDMAMIYEDTNELWLYLATLGSFSVPEYTPVYIDTLPEEVMHLASADIDADGWPDVVAVTQLRLYTYFGRDDPRGLVPSPGMAMTPINVCAGANVELAFADLNDDGAQEWLLAWTPCASGGASVNRQLRVMSPVPAPLPALSEDGRRVLENDPDLLVVRDIDDDGVLDLISVSDDRLVVLHGHGERGIGIGLFGSSAVTDLDAYSPVAGAAAGDINGDGATDLVILGEAAGQPQLTILIGQVAQGVRSLDFAAAVAGPQPAAQGLGLRGVFDVNGDGLGDLILAPPAQGTGEPLTVLLADGTPGAWSGSFTPLVPQAAALDAPAQHVLAAELDGDGHLDLILLGDGTGTEGYVTLLRGDGSGDFTAVCTPATCAGGATCSHPVAWGADLSLPTPLPLPVTTAAMGDLDADGDVDLVVGAFVGLFGGLDGSPITLLRNGPTACELFTPVSHDLAGQGVIDQLRIVDLNRDGVPDLLGAATEVFLRLGDPASPGAFGDPITLRSGVNVRRFILADLNYDGLEDLGAVNRNEMTLAVAHQQRRDYLARWNVILRPWDGTDGGAGNLFGAAAPDPPRYLAEGASTRIVVREFTDDAGSLLPGLRRAGALVDVAGRLEPLTAAWQTSGDLHLSPRVSAEGRVRTHLQARLGPVTADADGVERAAGLDLSPASGSPRGVVIDLPWRGEWLGVGSGSVEILVFARFTDWLRAADVPADNDEGVAASSLPSVADAEGWRTLHRTTEYFEDIPETTGALADGSGRRFIIDTSDATAPRVRILTDRLGVFQAFVVVP